MLLDVCLGTKSSWRILFVLAEAPGKAVERKEIQALTKSGNKVLTKFLLILEKFGMILVEKIGRKYYYKLNLNNPFVEKLIETINLEKTGLNNLDFSVSTILREFVYELTNLNLENLRNVVLFGSHAKRTASKDSDIDVAIITEDKESNEEILITDLIDKIKERFGKEIQPHYFTQKEFKDMKNPLVSEIIKDGLFLLKGK